jgi:hypothetical protein
LPSSTRASFHSRYHRFRFFSPRIAALDLLVHLVPDQAGEVVPFREAGDQRLAVLGNAAHEVGRHADVEHLRGLFVTM